jgi:uncharacterized cofD-like protein
MKNHLFSDDSHGLNFVAIGGGNGLSTLLSGLKRFVHNERESVRLDNLSAIVAVSDDGGSSGRLRDELQMLPPGDIRNCMVALSEDSLMLSKLFRHRFSGEGELGGHSFGNLFLAALTEITGDFAEAVKLSSEILASKGHIYPATDADVRLAAELTNGTIIRGETNIGKVGGGSIKRLFLDPETCRPLPEALAAIYEADLITVGPGSLFTSLLPPILVEGVAGAIAESSAVKVFICNLMTQPGETDGFTSRQHLEVFREYAPEIDFDYLIVNNRPVSEKQAEIYASEGARQIGVHGSISPETVEGAEIVYGNLLDEDEKVRHHSEKLAQVVLLCALQPKYKLRMVNGQS